MNGVKEMKKVGKIVVIGYDSGAAQIAAIRAGEMNGAITEPGRHRLQDGRERGEGPQGREAPENRRHRLLLLRQDQIDDPKIAAVLYQ